MFALSDKQLALVMTAAGGLPVEKRSVFLERVAARLRLRGYHFTDARTDRIDPIGGLAGNSKMVAGADTPSKRATPSIPAYLVEEMSVGRLAEVLQSLQFNRDGLCRISVDEGARNYLLRAAVAAGGDPGVKVRHAWRLIKPR
jgi:hypothetical protein